nr:LysE family transporter [uncultured Schaedlerella sp.]
MPGYVIGNFFVYSMINAFTPGPGNILALNTVTNYGWKKGKPLFFGIFTGYYVVQILCAVFVFGVSTFLPMVLGVMKYIGAAYILWLAFHIAVSRPEENCVEKSASFTKGFFLQFVNVKIYLFGITALTGYITDFNTSFGVLFLL